VAEDADAVFGDRPFFLTMTETAGPPAMPHVDVDRFEPHLLRALAALGLGS
jgi:hypothetical protein